MPISVRKLSPVIGAEVEGVDLSLPLTDEQVREVRDALLQNLVLFFRNQHLSPDQHKAFGRCFGRLHIHPAPLGVLEGHREIVIIKADENSKHIAGEEWHSDVSCDAEPPLGSILCPPAATRCSPACTPRTTRCRIRCDASSAA